jgi:hypothetical protein
MMINYNRRNIDEYLQRIRTKDKSQYIHKERMTIELRKI